MRSIPTTPLQFQRGISLTGLIAVLGVLGFIGIMAARVLPSYAEYSAIKAGIEKARNDGEGNVMAIRNSFEKAAEINDIKAITARDLVISRDRGTTEISFSYEKRIPLMGNASLMLEFSGSTSPDAGE